MKLFYLSIPFSLLPILALAQEPVLPEQDQFPQQMIASKLLESCASSSLTQAGRERRKYCAGFVSGVEEAVRILQQQHKLEASVCLPGNVTTRTLSDAFIRYSAKRQQYMDKPAAGMVLEALTETWPCSNKTEPD